MEKGLPSFMIDLRFLLSGEITIVLSATIEVTSSPGNLCWVASQMKAISRLLPSLKL